jgi:hypothetical protein
MYRLVRARPVFGQRILGMSISRIPPKSGETWVSLLYEEEIKVR